MGSAAERFVPRDDDVAPFTPRTRFVLWQALDLLAGAIDDDLDEVRDGASIDAVFDMANAALHDFPRLTRTQPLEWWEQVVRAADRLAEAARTGEGMAPRTVGEEALLYIAVTRDWADDAMDAFGPAEDDQYDALP